VLRTIGKHQRQFRHRREAFSPGAQQQAAHVLSHFCAAGLACCHDVDAESAQPARKLLHLRGFAYAIEAFKADELSSRHAHDLNTDLIPEKWHYNR
jgi:hypothetical protein